MDVESVLAKKDLKLENLTFPEVDIEDVSLDEKDEDMEKVNLFV